MYSKEVAKQLTQIAVVLPGAPVEVGQIIHFPFGQSGIWPFRKTTPRGSFELISTLQNLNITPKLTIPQDDGHPYLFSSTGTVKVNLGAGAAGNINTGAAANANASLELSVSFESTGAVYFAAAGCSTISISNLDEIQVDLRAHTNAILWDDTFLVTSVTTAKKAMIMQSSTSSASLTLKGDVKGLVTGSAADLNANANIEISSIKESSFIKPWSDNVTVFLGLHRFTRETFGTDFNIDVNLPAYLRGPSSRALGLKFTKSPKDVYRLEPVFPHEILSENDFDHLQSQS